MIIGYINLTFLGMVQGLRLWAHIVQLLCDSLDFTIVFIEWSFTGFGIKANILANL